MVPSLAMAIVSMMTFEMMQQNTERRAGQKASDGGD
jgi:hypothetical protein